MSAKSQYTSPFSWRYASPEMREIWSVTRTRLLWRELWVGLAEVQMSSGLVSPEQVTELKGKQNQLDLHRSLELEKEIQHDLMAELKTFAEQCPAAGGVLHLGATSMDIKDNTLILQQKAALVLTLEKISRLLTSFADEIKKNADIPLIAFTHLQPAEPSTLGYRLAQTGQDLLAIHEQLTRFLREIRAKGFTGAVGSSASFAALIGEKELEDFQYKMGERLGLKFFDVVTQTYPRLQDYQLLSILAGLGAVLSKFAFDLRVLQSPGFGEIAEPFGKNQIGSSAMPFKQNPIKAEKINSLARHLAQLPRVAWDNAAHSLLERTMDDSANRRIILPEAFLITDELLDTSQVIMDGLQVNQQGIAKNLADYGPFAATEILLMELVKAGADRQEMHKIIREHSLKAWAEVQAGQANLLESLLCSDPLISNYLDEGEIQDTFSGRSYLGDAEQRARYLAEKILKKISS